MSMMQEQAETQDCPGCGGERSRFWSGDRVTLWDCSTCGHHEPEPGEVAATLAKQRQAEMDDPEGQTAHGIPPQYHGAALADVPAAESDMRRLLDKAEPAGLLTLTGPQGTGKTRLAYALMREAYPVRIKCEKYRGTELAMRLQALAGSDMGQADREVRRLVELDGVLVIDDLGAEKVTDFTRQGLYEIIAGREEWGRPTLITTNLGIGQLADAFDKRIADRLAGGQVVTLDGKSWRLRRKEQEAD